MSTRDYDIPNLPGMRIKSSGTGGGGRGRKAKTQNFVYINGYAIEMAGGKKPHPEDRLDQLIKAKKEAKRNAKGTFRPGQTPLPTWLAKARQVLLFDAYFKEMVQREWRVRKVQITYFLSDDSMSITEVRQENSGIPQGQFLKRQRNVQKGDGTYIDFFHDLQVGSEITLYGRTFKIYGCNKSTREYFQTPPAPYRGIEMQPNTTFPDDPYTQARSGAKESGSGADGAVYRGVQKSPLKDFVEASMGKSVSNFDMKKFLANDGNVLRFYCQWDDTNSLYGAIHDYTLHYFLADDSIEILEVHEQNSGAAEFPRLLNRQKLSKQCQGLRPLGDRGEGENFYTWNDLRIGQTLQIFGRPVRVLDCDPSTREFYRSEGMRQGRALAKKVIAKPAIREMEPPPPNGFGSEEDSLGSCYSLMPKPPKRNFKKLAKMSNVTLKFSGKLVTSRASDKLRSFVVAFYLADDTCSVFEPQNRNSGIVGGKFLKRQQMKNTRGQKLQGRDFFVGAVLHLGGFKFKLEDIDEFSLKHMEKSPGDFPMANIRVILSKLRRKLNAANGGPGSRRGRTNPDAFKKTFLAADTDGSGFITMSELEQLLAQTFTESELTRQEVLTIMRYFDRDKSGRIDYKEFVDRICVSEEKFASDEFFSAEADHNYELQTNLADATMDVDKQNTLASLKHFHTKLAKPGQQQARLLQMFRVEDIDITGSLSAKGVERLLVRVAGLDPIDTRRVMDHHFPEGGTVTYLRFSNMLKYEA